jgi:hypothetical protein
MKRKITKEMTGSNGIVKLYSDIIRTPNENSQQSFLIDDLLISLFLSPKTFEV